MLTVSRGFDAAYYLDTTGTAYYCNAEGRDAQGRGGRPVNVEHRPVPRQDQGLRRAAGAQARRAGDVLLFDQATQMSTADLAAIVRILCVPRISSMALTSRVALPAVRP